jgi:hypothetical protein
MINIKRNVIEKVKNTLFKNKVVIIYGARRTGKTTLVKEILKDYPENSRYINCEHLVNKDALASRNIEKLKSFLGNYKLIVLDEAQNIDSIGHILKLLIDTYPEIQIIATGSSSFDLANQTGEPLVGRSRSFLLYPLSLNELKSQYDLPFIEAKLEHFLRFGSMPSVFNLSNEEAIEELNQITSHYLYKDILIFEGIKKSQIIENLLKVLALQLGSEVSFREISQLIGITHNTVARYIDLLEKCHIVFSLDSLSRNPRNEIKLSKKIYFYDLGIRNSIIQNFNALDLRNDIGALWENFCIIERMKLQQTKNIYYNKYFWRTNTQKEIDYIEEYGGVLHTFEFKWNPKKKVPQPSLFKELYPENTFTIINKDNFWEFLL